MKNRIFSVVAIVCLGAWAAGCASLCNFEEKGHQVYVKDVAKYRPDYAVQYEQNFYNNTRGVCSKYTSTPAN